jgi:hypothetical protein
LQLVLDAKACGGFWSNAEAKSCTSKVSVSRLSEEGVQGGKEATSAVTTSVSEVPLKRKREEHYGAKKRQKKLLAKLLVCERVMEKACGGENLSLERLPFADLLEHMRPGSSDAPLVSASNTVPREGAPPDWASVPAEIDPAFDMKMAGRGGSKKRARRAEAEVNRAQRKRWQVESFLHMLTVIALPGTQTCDNYDALLPRVVIIMLCCSV